MKWFLKISISDFEQMLLNIVTTNGDDFRLFRELGSK